MYATPTHPTKLLLKILYRCSYWFVQFKSHILDFQHSELNEESVCLCVDREKEEERGKEGKQKREPDFFLVLWYPDHSLHWYEGLTFLSDNLIQILIRK